MQIKLVLAGTISLLLLSIVSAEPLNDVNRYKSARTRFVKIESSPFLDQIPHIPDVYFEIAPLLDYWLGSEPQLVPPFNKPMFDRSIDVLRMHRSVVYPLILADLRSKEASDRARGVAVAGKLNAVEFFDEIVTIHKSCPESGASSSLIDMNDPRAIPILLAGNPENMGRYGMGLRRLSRDRPGNPELVRYLRSSEKKHRHWAAYILSECNDPALAPDLIGLLCDSEAKLRLIGLDMLRYSTHPKFDSVRPTVRLLMNDPHPDVRRRAVFYLAYVKDVSCAPVLLEMLKDKTMEHSQKSELANSIHFLTGCDFGYRIPQSDSKIPTAGDDNGNAILLFTEWISRYRFEP